MSPSALKWPCALIHLESVFQILRSAIAISTVLTMTKGKETAPAGEVAFRVRDQRSESREVELGWAAGEAMKAHPRLESTNRERQDHLDVGHSQKVPNPLARHMDV